MDRAVMNSNPAGAAEVPSLELKRVFDAPVERLWKAWTDRDALAQWMGPGEVQVTVEDWNLEPGGRFYWIFGESDGAEPLEGEFVEIKEPERLAFTWTWRRPDNNIANITMLVELTFKAQGDATELTLVHSKLPTPLARERHGEGWLGCFDCLEAHLAGSPV